MKVKIIKYTKELIGDVVKFEAELRRQENEYPWEIDSSYKQAVEESFNDRRFRNALSLLAYRDGKVVGRIDSTLIATHFDGSINAYLDWLCVLPSERHKGVAQQLLKELRTRLARLGADTLIALIAQNEGCQKFYNSVDNAKIGDEGIWMDL